MKIVQITAAADGRVYGLGEDNKLYYWKRGTGEWVLYIASRTVQA